jgi:hypothetical protein
VQKCTILSKSHPTHGRFALLRAKEKPLLLGGVAGRLAVLAVHGAQGSGSKGRDRGRCSQCKATGGGSQSGRGARTLALAAGLGTRSLPWPPARGSRPRARPPAVSRGHCLGVAEGPPPLGRTRAPAAGPLRALAAGLVAGRQTGRGRGGSVQSLQPWALQAAWRGQGPYGRASRPLVPGRRARARDRAGPLAAERQAGRKNAQPGVAEARMNCAVMCAPP